MSRRPPTSKILAATLLLAFAPVSALYSQHTTALQPDATAPHRTRLFLKDGSYQIVMSYKIVGNIVHYISAERGGAEEEIPLPLVDLDATKRWEKQHAQPGPDIEERPPPREVEQHDGDAQPGDVVGEHRRESDQRTGDDRPPGRDEPASVMRTGEDPGRARRCR